MSEVQFPLAPYRSNAIQKKLKEQVAGLIVIPKPHNCKLPGFWSRLFRGIARRPFLWRCQCGIVHNWDHYYPGWEYRTTELKTWIEAGGGVKG